MAAVESAAATNCLRETLFQVSVILAIVHRPVNSLYYVPYGVAS